MFELSFNEIRIYSMRCVPSSDQYRCLSLVVVREKHTTDALFNQIPDLDTQSQSCMQSKLSYSYCKLFHRMNKIVYFFKGEEKAQNIGKYDTASLIIISKTRNMTRNAIEHD